MFRYAATTFKYSFDYQQEDIYWCTADVGKSQTLVYRYISRRDAIIIYPT